MTALVFDFGLKHIGVAVALRQVGFARGLAVIDARDGQPRWATLDPLVDAWRPTALVVGEPLHMTGEASPMAARARAFGARLEARYALPVEYADERLSTFEARARSADAAARPRATRERSARARATHTRPAHAQAAHARAAEIIAETWLSH